MFNTALIVFRESLEAALIIGIIAAATRGIPGRGRWLLAGVAIGASGASAVAVSAGLISALADGLGQELFNACILALAVVMLAFHNIWIASRGRALTAQAQNIGGAVRAGNKTLSALVVVIAVAVLREGSETVLFLLGIATSSSRTQMLLGGLTGLLGGVAVGSLLYTGLVRIPMQLFFKVTSVLVLLLAASMAAQAANFLAQAGVLADSGPLWDSSALLSERSAIGALLHGLAGYTARPTAPQLIAYAATIASISAASFIVHRWRHTQDLHHPRPLRV